MARRKTAHATPDDLRRQLELLKLPFILEHFEDRLVLPRRGACASIRKPSESATRQAMPRSLCKRPANPIFKLTIG